MHTLAIIGARLNSSRLPRKHLLDLAGEVLISRLYQRLLRCKKIDEIVLATTADDYNQDLVVWAKRNKIAALAYHGDVNDLMGRLDTLIQQKQPEAIVYICGDCPLVEPGFIDHALQALEDNPKAETIKLNESIVSIHEGMHFYRYSGWQKLISISHDKKSREHVGYGDRVSPVLNAIAIDDSADFSKITHRISVDTPADYRFMSEIYRRWYQHHDEEEIVDLHWVQSQLLEDPSLIAANQHVMQKAPDKTYGEAALYCHVSEKIGMGHLKRCAIIAEALQEHLGMATTIYVAGAEKSLPWLTTKTRWLNTFSELIAAMKKQDIWLIDLHPDFINCGVLRDHCRDARAATRQPIIALDKLHCLLGDIDELFVPSFYSEHQHPDVNYGWENYFLPKFSAKIVPKRLTVFTGGSDALGYGKSLPALVEQRLAKTWQLVWVQGPYAAAPHFHDASRWELLSNPKELSEIMATSDLILSCYGLSLFEAMASGALSILLPTQNLCSERELAALKAEKVCLVCESTKELANILASVDRKDEDFRTIRENAVLRLGQSRGTIRLLKSVNRLILQQDCLPQ